MNISNWQPVIKDGNHKLSEEIFWVENSLAIVNLEKTSTFDIQVIKLKFFKNLWYIILQINNMNSYSKIVHQFERYLYTNIGFTW